MLALSAAMFDETEVMSEDDYVICLLNDICHLRQITGGVIKVGFLDKYHTIYVF